MAHGVTEVLGEGNSVKMVHQKQQQQQSVQQQTTRKSVGVMGSRRIFAPSFKLKVLDSYRNDIDCRGNQRATARKYGIHRRQIQKWLQCEDNLRNSCAESSNTGIVTTTVISSAGLSKPDVTVTEATGPAVTPAAPALNLSLARLHGDELTAQQGPPPLLSHPPHTSSPSSPQYNSQVTTGPTGLTLRVGTLGYHEYSPNQEQHHLRREVEDRVQVPEMHGYSEVRVEQDRSYYVLNSNTQREHETASSSFDARTEMKVYQTLTSYHSAHSEQRYNENEIGSSIRRNSPITHSQREHHYGEIEESASPCVDGKSYGLLLAPSMIKTERASPDSAATPGPCESANSPSASGLPLSPISHQGNNSSSASVHFDSPRTTTSPCSQVHERTQACSTPDSEKKIPCLHRKREYNESTDRLERKEAEMAGASPVKVAIGRAMVKEELIEEENNDEAASSSVDYQRPPSGSPIEDSRPVSPIQDREGYSLPSSPRGLASSERSSSSCSDSEMDPLDCSPGSQHSSNDLTRRRSFSLRFKLDVLDAFHRDAGVAGNQRATARKFGINRRQVQKWLGQETELRGEIALRGNTRQRLGPAQDTVSGESPVDLRTTSYVSSLSYDRIEAEYERSPPPLYWCDIGSSTSQHLSYYHPATVDSSSETEHAGPCGLTCCIDSHTTTSTVSCYQELSSRGSCYAESQSRMYCYSPRDYSEVNGVPDPPEEISSPLKRQHCNLSCCYDTMPSPKRLCLEMDDSMKTNSCQDSPPQDTPLCLVKPKRIFDNSTVEPVTSTVPTPPATVAPPCAPTTKKDAILFKPYLDNPVSKPTKDHVIRGLSPVSSQSIINNNNNNCQSICNLNEGRGHDYALELSFRLPVSWRTHPASPYTEFPQVRSAFVRYPTSPHYT